MKSNENVIAKIIFIKFHADWTKIVDFFANAQFLNVFCFFHPDFRSIPLQPKLSTSVGSLRKVLKNLKLFHLLEILQFTLQ